MLEAFKQHITQNFSFLYTHKVLIAVSGGLDSMALLHLCKESKFNIGVAHCNFKLRGRESDADALFVQDFCLDHKIPFYTTSFETSAFAKKAKLSTQVAARDLRYQWFEEISGDQGYYYILTAHHQNDDFETFLINLGRGTGIDGLTGIPSINGKIVRPLLPFSRKRINEYALNTNIIWREDGSNATDHYIRNHLRHHAIPELEKAIPTIFKGFEKTQSYINQTAELLSVYKMQLKQEYLKARGSSYYIDLKVFSEHPTPDAVLYALLSDFGFTAWEDIYKLPLGQTGKQVFSETHRILKNRNELIISPRIDHDEQEYTLDYTDAMSAGIFGELLLAKTTEYKVTSKNEIIVDLDRLDFPLRIRKWKDGDYFYPLGMKGKKKLSKYLKDEKVSLIDKENVWLLCNDKEIVWVMGYRADDRFKVRPETKNRLKLEYTHV